MYDMFNEDDTEAVLMVDNQMLLIQSAEKHFFKNTKVLCPDLESTTVLQYQVNYLFKEVNV